MKRSLCAVLMTGLFLLSGCGGGEEDVPSQAAKGTAISAFVSGMGCNDADCTDASHHHDCPADCTDYSHHHSCPLDCTEADHHHTEAHHDEEHQQTGTAAVAAISFVSGMGCSDANCTDPSHHHDCPADCTDYSHHHSCPLDCTEADHHHAEAHHDEEHQQSDTASIAAISFVSGMGCNDTNCTDASHHHDCPADCTDYSHYHNCSLDCTEASHHHISQHHESEHH